MEKNRRQIAFEKEIKFLSGIGITFYPYREGMDTGVLFKEDVVVGYIVEDEIANLNTQIQMDDIFASYQCSSWNDDLIVRNFTIDRNGKEISLCDIETDKYDWLHFSDSAGNERFMEIQNGKLSCGKSSPYQNILVNGDWFKGKLCSIDKTIEEFRYVWPELMDSLFEKYNGPKGKVLQKK